ncbi:MAG: recombinase family protein [Firmicutes bacterium]|nr:recombinase family protein [Bacillota bacterium]
MYQLPKLSAGSILMYLRKSRTDDPALTVQEVLSKHEQMLDDWVARNCHGQRVPESNRYREIVSGETIDSRPMVQAMLRQVESPRYKAVLVVEPQRLSRGDLEDIGRMVKLLRYSGTLVITLQYSYDLSDERDRDLFEQELKRGNEFLEYQKRIMGNGRLLSVQNGNFIGQTAPYGYRKITIKEGKRKCHTLEPDPETAPIVHQIFDMYASGTSASQIARTLTSMGVPTATGAASWTVASIRPILINDHYIGMVHWNRRKTVKVVEDGEVYATRPRSQDYLSYPGKHQAIIERSLWDSVQEIYGSHLPIKEKAKYANPFAGLVRCQCGSCMSRRTYVRNGAPRSAPRLLCVNQAQCGTASCSVEEFTAEVIRSLNQEIADFDLSIASIREDAEVERQRNISRLEKRLEELDRLELSQWDKYTQEDMPRHIFEKLHEKLLRDRQAIQAELQEVRLSSPTKESYEEKRAKFSDAVASLQNPAATVKEQNAFLKQCITSIVYSREKKQSSNRRFGTPEPIHLDIQFRV